MTPYLFLILMTTFQKDLGEQIMQKQRRPVIPDPGETEVTELLYADDTLLADNTSQNLTNMLLTWG